MIIIMAIFKKVVVSKFPNYDNSDNSDIWMYRCDDGMRRVTLKGPKVK